MDPQPYSLNFNAFVPVLRGQWAGSLWSIGAVALPPGYAALLLSERVSPGSQTCDLCHIVLLTNVISLLVVCILALLIKVVSGP